MTNQNSTDKRRGFAALSPERRAEISRAGGKAAHERGVAHRFVKGGSLAREAGRKGGLARGRNKESAPISLLVGEKQGEE